MKDVKVADGLMQQEHIGVIGDAEPEQPYAIQEKIFIGIIEEPNYPAIKLKEQDFLK
jgi:hypothetical protein